LRAVLCGRSVTRRIVGLTQTLETPEPSFLQKNVRKSPETFKLAVKPFTWAAGRQISLAHDDRRPARWGANQKARR